VHNDGRCNPIRNIIIFLPEYTVSHINSIYKEKRFIVVIYVVTQQILYNIQLNVATYLLQLYGLPQATRRNM